MRRRWIVCVLVSGLVACDQERPGGLEWATALETDPDPAVVVDVEARQRIAATGLPWRVVDEASGVEFLLVPAGRYARGSAADDPFNRDNERPRHQVTLRQPFYLGRYEVTNAQMRSFRPSFSSGTFYRDESLSLDGDDQPAVDVSWLDAQAFARHFDYRLPTEAEWEWAARAGVSSRYPWGNDVAAGEGWGNVFGAETKARIVSMDWDCFAFADGFDATAPVGSFRPNAWGFFDLYGNAWEHVLDGFDDQEYTAHAGGAVDPYRAEGRRRTLRGGGFGNAPRGSGIPYRFGMDAEARHDGNGFRVLRPTAEEAPKKAYYRECDTCEEVPWIDDGVPEP